LTHTVESLPELPV